MVETSEDEPGGYTPSQFAHLDDAALFHEYHTGELYVTARVEIEKRRKFERRWKGEWASGPQTRIPAPPPEYRHLVELGAPRPKKAFWRPTLHSEVTRRGKAKIGPVPLVDGRLAIRGGENMPRNNKEREQAYIVRFSKLSDKELIRIAEMPTNAESKAARVVLEWRKNQ